MSSSENHSPSKFSREGIFKPDPVRLIGFNPDRGHRAASKIERSQSGGSSPHGKVAPSGPRLAFSHSALIGGLTLAILFPGIFAWTALRQESADFLQPWEPSWAGDHLTRKSFTNRVYWAQRAINTGSTTIPMSLVDAYLDRDVPIIQVYGSTETAPIVNT